MADQRRCSIKWVGRQWVGDRNQSGTVSYDADVVGLGVLGAFLATALTALCALVFGLATHSIPPHLTNNVDDCLRNLLRRGFVSARQLFRIPSLGRTENEDYRDKRIKTLESFMIAVSDQILVSEISVLVAAFSRISDLTVYSANVVTSLALLASSVHLATMPVLKEYNSSNRFVTFSKLVLIVAACILLVVLLVFQTSATWSDCAYFKCAIRAFEGPANVQDGINSYLVPLLVIYVHYEAIKTFFLPSRKRHDDSSLAASLDRPSRRRQQSALSIGNDSTPATADNAKSVRRLDMYEHYANQKTRKSNKRMLVPFNLGASWSFEEYSDSFTFRILWLGSSCAYGITDVFLVRSNAIGMDGDPNEWGFGQIVPLVLLLLPLLTVSQSVLAYYSDINSRSSSPRLTMQEPKPEASTEEVAQAAHNSRKSRQNCQSHKASDTATGCEAPQMDRTAEHVGIAMQDLQPRSRLDQPTQISYPPQTGRKRTSLPGVGSTGTISTAHDPHLLSEPAVASRGPQNKGYLHRVDATSWHKVRTWVYLYTALMCGFTIIYGVILTGIVGSDAALVFIVISAVISLRKYYGNWRLRRYSKEQGWNTDYEAPDTSATYMNAQAAENLANDDEQ